MEIINPDQLTRNEYGNVLIVNYFTLDVTYGDGHQYDEPLLSNEVFTRIRGTITEIPYPTKQVANGVTGGIWGEENRLSDVTDQYRYRLNFSFPQKDPGDSSLNLMSLELVDMIPPGVRIVTPDDQIQVRTTTGEDVTRFFHIELKPSWITDEGEIRDILEITARNWGNYNPLIDDRFYREWSDLYVEFVVSVEDYTMLTTNLDGQIEIVNNFTLTAIHGDRRIVSRESNNVYTRVGGTRMPELPFTGGSGWLLMAIIALGFSLVGMTAIWIFGRNQRKRRHIDIMIKQYKENIQ
jgi:hypothetical protein